MKLGEYKNKRNFAATSEPAVGRRSASLEGPVYVIQKHAASRLHYDLRLEADGALLSWAVPKEPPLEPGVRRLAVQTEDHPLGYETFEGTIPEGQYGAGTVEIWDTGTYRPVETSEGKRVVDLNGRRLRGRYALVRLKPKPGDKDKNWLFFKLQDRERGAA
jgi:bifunctional non-homologous end joining protein LigD